MIRAFDSSDLGFKNLPFRLDAKVLAECLVAENGQLLCDCRSEVLSVDRLAEIVVERHVQHVEVRVDCGHHDDSSVVPTLGERLENLVTGHRGHMSVEQHDIGFS
jgi:hypothetical protein